MKTAELVREQVKKIPIGEPFTPTAFLCLGSRTTVYKALSRLVQTGAIMRVTHGVFARTEATKYGNVPPEPVKVARLKANGAAIEIHGAEAARRFGLSTQVPVQPVYYTTGPTKRFMLGLMPVSLRHISPRKIVSPGTNVGLAISALWYMGKEQVGSSVFEAIKRRLTQTEYEQLKQSAASMPAWMADALSNYERQMKHA